MSKVAVGYVVTCDGKILVQVPDDNQWGFALVDDDQAWPGGFGIASEWELIPDGDPRITAQDRQVLGWILEEYR